MYPWTPSSRPWFEPSTLCLFNYINTVHLFRVLFAWLSFYEWTLNLHNSVRLLCLKENKWCLKAPQHLACSGIKPEVSNLLVTNPVLYQLSFCWSCSCDELSNSFIHRVLQKFEYINKQNWKQQQQNTEKKKSTAHTIFIFVDIPKNFEVVMCPNYGKMASLFNDCLYLLSTFHIVWQKAFFLHFHNISLFVNTS